MTHAVTVKLDHARGGWLARCSCGWQAKWPTYYRARSERWAKRHVDEAAR